MEEQRKRPWGYKNEKTKRDKKKNGGGGKGRGFGTEQHDKLGRGEKLKKRVREICVTRTVR